jgi:hypothetical protein
MTATFTLTGRVLDKSKQPVVGVSVIVVPLAGVTRDPSVNEIYAATVRAVTDADGRLVVPGSTDLGIPLVGGEQYLVRSTLNSVLRPVIFTGPTSGTLDLADIEPEPLDLPNTWHDTIDAFVARLVALEAGGGGSATWPVTGTPSTFPPAAHTHVAADVTDLSDTITQAIADAGSGAALNVASLEYFGHSYTSGSGAHATSFRFSSRLNRALNIAVEQNFGNAGTKIINEGSGAGNGGWTYLGRNRVPTPRLSGSSSEYAAAVQVASLDYGVNEFIGGTAPNATQFAHSFRTCIHHLRACKRYSHDDSVLSYTGGFTGVTDYDAAQVGRSLRGSAGAGATVTFAVPATFPGGTVGMSFVGALGRGARLSFTVDGVGKGTLDVRDIHPVNGSFNEGTKRLTGLSAGAHTVVATVDAVSPADVFFDVASIEAPIPPLVLVHNIATTVTQGPFTLGNAAIAGVVAEFDASVVLLDINTVLGNGDPARFNADNLHPSDLGHALIAKTMYDAIAANADLIPSADAVLVG